MRLMSGHINNKKNRTKTESIIINRMSYYDMKWIDTSQSFTNALQFVGTLNRCEKEK